MIYLASRSHRKYLDKLVEIANRPGEHHLVSITGGLAFLHAISDRAQSLTLVDLDPEVNDYGRALVEVLIKCTTRAQLFGLLTGKALGSSDGETVRFLARPYEERQLIFNELSVATRQVIERWYYKGTFDVASAELRVEDKTLHFFGLNLSHQHFNWHAERDCFATEDSYRRLNRDLSRLNPRFLTMPLEHFHFDACNPDTLILASNADSPLFTRNDAVLRAVERGGQGRCHYISRTRDCSRASQGATTSFKESNLAMPPLAVGFPGEYQQSIREAFPHDWQFVSAERYVQELLYDQECLLFFIGPHGHNLDELTQHLRQQLPIHQRIGFLSTHAATIEEIVPDLLLSYQESEKLVVAQSAELCLTGRLFELKYRCPYR
jgi:hypothetical protein